MKKNLILLKVLAFSIFLIIFGCREEMDWTKNQKELLRAEKFFNYEKSESKVENVELINSSVQKLKQINEQKDFLSKISDQYGIPNWNYLVNTDVKKFNSVANKGDEAVDMLIIPLVQEENNFLTSLLYIENPDSKNPTIYTVTNEELENFVRDVQIEKNIRENVLLTFLSFDRKIFGDRRYSSIPLELFEKVHVEEGENYKSFNISEPVESNPHGRQIMECITIYHCTGCQGPCDLCHLCVSPYCYSYSSGSGSDSGSNGDSGSPSGGGGGSSGSGSNTPPTIPWYVANPNIYDYNANVRAVFVMLYNKNIQLSDEELDYLENHNDVTLGFKSYLSNITLEKAQFVKWGIEFFLQNPSTTWEQFQNLFMKTPCEDIKTSTNDDKYKSNITTLEGKTNDSYESGYRMGTPVPNSGQSGTQNQLLQNKPGTREVNMTIFSNTFALMHSHYDGLYPIFSPGDILLFNQWVIYARNYNNSPTSNPKIPINALTLTVVTSNGNYMLNFDGTDVAPFPNYTQQEFVKLNNEYQDKYLDKTHTNGSFDMDKVETEFLKFVKDKMNMTGLKLFKVGSNGTNTEIYLENGNRKTKQCP